MIGVLEQSSADLVISKLLSPQYMVGTLVQGTSKVRDDVQGARSSQSGLGSLLVNKSKGTFRCAFRLNLKALEYIVMCMTSFTPLLNELQIRYGHPTSLNCHQLVIYSN